MCGVFLHSQLTLELRTATWYIASCLRQNLDAVPSAGFVEGMLAEAGKEKRDASRRREHIDADELVEAGKWLTPSVRALSPLAPRFFVNRLHFILLCFGVFFVSVQDQQALSEAVKKYFSAERLDPTTKPNDDDAWQVQGHLILHLLNDNVVAVPRSELLGSLIRGSSFDWNKEKGQWAMKVVV